MDGKRVHDAQGHGAVGRFGVGVLDLCSQDVAAFDDRRDLGDRLVGGVFNQGLPVTVECLDAGAIRGNLLVDQLLDGV